MDYYSRIRAAVFYDRSLALSAGADGWTESSVTRVPSTWYTQARHVALMQLPLDPRCHVDADVACQGIQKPAEVWLWHGVHHAN